MSSPTPRAHSAAAAPSPVTQDFLARLSEQAVRDVFRVPVHVVLPVDSLDDAMDFLAVRATPGTLFVPTPVPEAPGVPVSVTITYEGQDELMLILSGVVGWRHSHVRHPGDEPGMGVFVDHVQPDMVATYSAIVEAAATGSGEQGLRPGARPPGARLLPFELPLRTYTPAFDTVGHDGFDGPLESTDPGFVPAFMADAGLRTMSTEEEALDDSALQPAEPGVVRTLPPSPATKASAEPVLGVPSAVGLRFSFGPQSGREAYRFGSLAAGTPARKRKRDNRGNNPFRRRQERRGPDAEDVGIDDGLLGGAETDLLDAAFGGADAPETHEAPPQKALAEVLPAALGIANASGQVVRLFSGGTPLPAVTREVPVSHMDGGSTALTLYAELEPAGTGQWEALGSVTVPTGANADALRITVQPSGEVLFALPAVGRDAAWSARLTTGWYAGDKVSDRLLGRVKRLFGPRHSS